MTTSSDIHDAYLRWVSATDIFSSDINDGYRLGLFLPRYPRNGPEIVRNPIVHLRRRLHIMQGLNPAPADFSFRPVASSVFDSSRVSADSTYTRQIWTSVNNKWTEGEIWVGRV